MYMRSPQKSDSSSGQEAQAIEAATQELKQRNIAVENYNVRTVKSEESTIIIFTPPDYDSDYLGNNSAQPGFEVEITPDLKTKRISAIR
ncbi:MAG: hypothetical protein ACM3TU_00940 [Bacillota bacterium]